MPAPYSEDLRLRVMDAVRSGMTYEMVTQRFRVINSTILRWVRRQRETGSYAALPMGGQKPFVLADERDWLRQRFVAKPDVTLREVLAELHDRGIEVSYFALWHIVRRAELTFKKRPFTPASKIDSMSPSPRVAALRHDGVIAPCVFGGPVNGERCIAYVKNIVVPSLRAGDIVVLDNLASHKSSEVRQAILAAGARIVFLPADSPDLNPSEQVFAKIKTLVRKQDPRTVEATWRSIGTVLDRFTPKECQRYIEHAGYGST